MARRPDIGEVFRNAWSGRCAREYGILGNEMISGMAIRRFATSFEGANMWKYLDGGATQDQLYLLGLDVVRLMHREDGANNPFCLCMGRYDKDDIIELGRIAYKAVCGPRNKVIKALFRRYKE